MIRHLMNLVERALQKRVIDARPPDFIVGGPDRPYLLRWWLLPRNPVLNVYLHRFLRDDDDRALHDHPWHWASILLLGSYIEHTIAAGGIHHQLRRDAPSLKLSPASRAHRIELLREVVDNGDPIVRADDPAVPCTTLFITGPRFRQWGFHCPERGWVHWRDFTSDDDKGAIGRGCGEVEP